jgi:hypothetical protein
LHITTIENIAKSRKYYPKCKNLAKRNFMADELHAEFLLRLCEIGEDKVNEASEYIDWFCLDVINKIWGKRTRVKSYETGSTSPFFEFSTSHISEQQVFITPDYDVTFDFKAKEAKDILNKDINSDNKDTNYKARVFTYSVGMTIENGEVKDNGIFKNALQFSKNSGINYCAVWKAYNEYRKRLKDKLKL